MSINLEAIADRVNAATPGPWKASTSDHDILMLLDNTGHALLRAPGGKSNANFISHSREDIPSLLAEVKRLANELDAMQSVARHAEEIESELASVTAERDAAVATMSDLLKHGCDDICAYCKNRVECKGKKCDCYEYGNGLEDVNGEKCNSLWTCEDFDYGTCKKMKGTKCEGCFDENYSGFEWRGPQKG